MEIIQLRYFVKIAELESFSRAADGLFLSQPALSKSIHGLELELGVKLFDRRSGKIFLNENGKLFLSHVRKVFAELSAAENALSERRKQNTNTVTFSNVLTVLAKDLLNDYMIEHKDIQLIQRIMPPEESVKCLENCTIDFAICLSPIMDDMVEWKHIFFDPNFVVFHENHPLSGRDSIELTELKNERFLVNTIHVEGKRLFMAQCKQAGFVPNIVHEGNNTEFINELVIGNFGIRLIPQSVLRVLCKRDHWLPEMKFVRISDDYCRSAIGVATLKGRTLPAPARKLLDYLVSGLGKYR
jgi:DNA-binding transcriptional LysR family regulator